MREIKAQEIRDAVAALCIRANRELPEDLEACIRSAGKAELSDLARSILHDLGRNLGRRPRAPSPNLPGYRHGRRVCRSRPGGPYRRGI